MKRLLYFLVFQVVLCAVCAAQDAPEQNTQDAQDTQDAHNTQEARDTPDAEEGTQKTAKRKSVVLLLSGGGALGYGHLPVIELIEELEIPVDMVIGVSSGSIVAGLYSAGYTSREMKDAFFNMEWTAIFADKPEPPFKDKLASKLLGLELIKESRMSLENGISTGTYIYSFFKGLTVKIPSYTDFDTLKIPFRAGVMRTDNAEFTLIKEGCLAEVIRASMGIPGMFNAWTIDGVSYVDGGVRDNLPIKLARDMGYDIVIAVDLFSGIQTFRESPIDMVNDFVNLHFNSISSEQYKYADVVIQPDTKNFSMLDFINSKEIYDAAYAKREEYRAALLEVKQKIYSDGIPEEPLKNSSADKLYYKEIKEIVPTSIKINGAVPSDKSVIEKYFYKSLREKPLSREALNSFFKYIYKTGNYSFVRIRLDRRQANGNEAAGGNNAGGNNAVLELILTPITEHSLRLQFSGSYNASFISDTYGMLTLNMDLVFSNFLNPNSILGAGWTLNDKIETHVFYVQPILPYFSLWGRAAYMHETDIISNILGDSGSNLPLGVDASVWIALYKGRSFVFNGGGRGVFINGESYFAKRSMFYNIDSIGNTGALGVFFNIEQNSLDYNILPSRGFYVGAEAEIFFPLPNNGEDLFCLTSAQICAAIPINRQFSFITKGFAGADTTGNAKNNPVLAHYFLWSTESREYFPQSPSVVKYGQYSGAFYIAIQFKPWETITIFGGQFFISVSAGAGTVFWNLEELKQADSYLWNGSLNASLRLSSSFAIHFRAGVASAEHRVNSSAVPFIAIDIGLIR